MRRPKILGARLLGVAALPVALVATAAIVSASSYSVFTSTTNSPNNSFSAGSVVLTNDSTGSQSATGSALYTATGITPTSAPVVRCVAVQSTGSLPSSVRLYTQGVTNTPTGGTLAQYLKVQVEIGTAGSTCSGFTAASSIVAAGTTLATLDGFDELREQQGHDLVAGRRHDGDAGLPLHGDARQRDAEHPAGRVHGRDLRLGGGQHLIPRLHRLGDLGATLLVLLCRTALALVTSLALLAVAPALVGLTSTVVMSDSMAPGIRAGDVVVVRAVPTADVRVGQVVLVDDPSIPGRLRLHRVAERERAGFVLKGDANAQRDPTPVAASAVHGVGFLRVPAIGLPLLWLRTGATPLALLTLAGVLAAALVVALLDGSSGGATARVLRRLVRRALRSRPRRLAWLGLVGVVVAAPAAHLPHELGPASWAAFVGTSRSPSNAFTAGTWCPALPKPVITGSTGTAPDIAYSFAAAGTAEPNVGGLGAAYGASLSTSALRTSGTCTPGASPSVRFGGGESIVSVQAYPPNVSATQSLWFNPTSAAGVLLDAGGTTPARPRPTGSCTSRPRAAWRSWSATAPRPSPAR